MTTMRWMSRGRPLQASFTCTASIALVMPAYVRDSKLYGPRARLAADDTFLHFTSLHFTSFHFTSPLDSHLIISSLIVVLLGCPPRGRCIFYFYELQFSFSHFPFLPFLNGNRYFYLYTSQPKMIIDPSASFETFYRTVLVVRYSTNLSC